VAQKISRERRGVPDPARLLTNFLTNVHAMRIAGQLTLKSAFVVTAAIAVF
jgi:hypothetical protein